MATVLFLFLCGSTLGVALYLLVCHHLVEIAHSMLVFGVLIVVGIATSNPTSGELIGVLVVLASTLLSVEVLDHLHKR